MSILFRQSVVQNDEEKRTRSRTKAVLISDAGVGAPAPCKNWSILQR